MESTETQELFWVRTLPEECIRNYSEASIRQEAFIKIMKAALHSRYTGMQYHKAYTKEGEHLHCDGIQWLSSFTFPFTPLTDASGVPEYGTPQIF